MTDSHRSQEWRNLRQAAFKIAQRDDAPCCRCGGPIDYTLPSNTKLGPTIDHLIPLGIGGDLLPSLDKLAPAHRTCNSRYGMGHLQHLNERHSHLSITQSNEPFFRAPTPTPRPRHARNSTVTLRNGNDREKAFSFTDGNTAGGPSQGVTSGPPEAVTGSEGQFSPNPAESEENRLYSQANIDVPWLNGDEMAMPDTGVWPRLMSGPHPRAVGSLGAEVIARIEERRLHDPMVPRMQKPLRWWQKLVLMRAYEIDAEGKLVWETVIITCPRQVGKSVLLRELALDRITQFDHFGEPQLVLHVAKDATIANEIQTPARQWAGIMERQGEPWHPVGSSGAWAVEYEGFMGRWLLRTKFSIYGYSASVAIVDEAWHLDQSIVEDGIEPTMIEREQPQLWLFSTAHAQATTLMRNKRARALDTLDVPEETLLVEWSAPSGASRFDREAMMLASPYWDERRRRFLESRTGQNGFEEQWLNIWPKERQAPGWVTAEAWNDCAVPVSVMPAGSGKDIGLTFAVYPDGLQIDWYVVAAWRDNDEKMRVVELGILHNRKDALALVAEQAAGRSVTLVIPRVLRGRVPKMSGVRQIILAGEADIAAATTTVRPLIQNGRLGHTGSERMTDHILRGVAEKWGDTIRLSGKLSGGPIEMAKAVVLAVWWAGRAEDRRRTVVA